MAALVEPPATLTHVQFGDARGPSPTVRHFLPPWPSNCSRKESFVAVDGSRFIRTQTRYVPAAEADTVWRAPLYDFEAASPHWFTGAGGRPNSVRNDRRAFGIQR